MSTFFEGCREKLTMSGIVLMCLQFQHPEIQTKRNKTNERCEKYREISHCHVLQTLRNLQVQQYCLCSAFLKPLEGCGTSRHYCYKYKWIISLDKILIASPILNPLPLTIHPASKHANMKHSQEIYFSYLSNTRSGAKISFPGWSIDLHIKPTIKTSIQQLSKSLTWS